MWQDWKTKIIRKLEHDHTHTGRDGPKNLAILRICDSALLNNMNMSGHRRVLKGIRITSGI